MPLGNLFLDARFVNLSSRGLVRGVRLACSPSFSLVVQEFFPSFFVGIFLRKRFLLVMRFLPLLDYNSSEEA